ncbi:organic solute transporter subunit beta [Mesocricetus auratus]|uniref:Organic solute transporter subunit beta n=1 Tax=Mesocricetus auratus TaxID=10036 RepID=A0A1U7QY80_MESAU|nr:organic solute transporter subunit beta [Mesocricetus auratus]
MDHSVEGAAVSPEVPQELLEEMIWVFRVEDAAPWNYSILVLAVLVAVVSLFLLRRSILANRNRKKQTQDKETPEALHLDDSRMKENSSLSNLRETLMLISEKPDLPPGEPELNERDARSVFLPDPQETES